MTKILVTGVNGFVGQHVASTLARENIVVIGVSNQDTVDPAIGSIVSKYYSCDLTDPEQVEKINLKDIDAIINLAGFAKVGDSIGNGELYNKVNIGVHTVLYEECLKQNAFPRIIAVSTGAVYDPRQKLPITESSLLIPRDQTNEYVISKQLMEEALDVYREAGLEVIVARPFNHSGPGQLPGFLLPDLGEQISSALVTNKPILVGNLATKRDYTDVRDVAKAYVALATYEISNSKDKVYNICSGKSVSGEEILEHMLTAFNATDLKIVVDEKKIRPNDVMDIYGSHEALTKATGWKPEISIEQMIHDYAQWRSA